MKEINVLQLFECCRLVCGAKNSLLIDLQRNTYRKVPNQLAELIDFSSGKSIEEIKANYSDEFKEIVDENIQILLDEEYLFFTNNPEWFTEMDLTWDEPRPISNAIIDINKKSNHDFDKIWRQLSCLGCEHIQIRAFDYIDLNIIEEYINQIKNKRIISIDLILLYNSKSSNQDYIDFVHRQPRIHSVLLHGALSDNLVFEPSTGMGFVFSLKNIISSETHCGMVDNSLFNIHIKSFTESIHHNSCLDRKISIDAEGNIKNCPSMKESFGNIRDTTLAEAIEKPGFKKYWDINKDKIRVCKDCEFRYICTDCRAYVEDPEDFLSKPLKCGYNPYTGEWSEWSTNPLKQKAIDFYGMREMMEENNSKYPE